MVGKDDLVGGKPRGTLKGRPDMVGPELRIHGEDVLAGLSGSELLKDRTSKGKVFLQGPELEAAVQARKDVSWNPAWAKRYAGKNALAYGEVVGWLERSERKSRARARIRLWILMGVVMALAFVSVIAWWAEREAQRSRARELSALAATWKTEDPARAL